MRRTVVLSLALALLSTAPALADGCYVRHTTAAELAAHPAQAVASMRVKIGASKYGPDFAAVMSVEAANQNRARIDGNGGKSFIQTFSCFDNKGVLTCSADCDSGNIEIAREDGKVLVFHTKGLAMSGVSRLRDLNACSYGVNLAARPGEDTTYRLDRAPDAACEGW